MTSSQTVQTRDPVCGMTVQDDPDAIAWEYQGVRYLFCARGCKEQFQEHPDQYVRTGTRSAKPRLGRELALALLFFLIALAVVLAFRNIKKATQSTSLLDQSQSVSPMERGTL